MRRKTAFCVRHRHLLLQRNSICPTKTVVWDCDIPEGRLRNVPARFSIHSKARCSIHSKRATAFVQTFCWSDPALPAVDSSQDLLACKGLPAVNWDFVNWYCSCEPLSKCVSVSKRSIRCKEMSGNCFWRLKLTKNTPDKPNTNANKVASSSVGWIQAGLTVLRLWQSQDLQFPPRPCPPPANQRFLRFDASKNTLSLAPGPASRNSRSLGTNGPLDPSTQQAWKYLEKKLQTSLQIRIFLADSSWQTHRSAKSQPADGPATKEVWTKVKVFARQMYVDCTTAQRQIHPYLYDCLIVWTHTDKELLVRISGNQPHWTVISPLEQ